MAFSLCFVIATISLLQLNEGVFCQYQDCEIANYCTSFWNETMDMDLSSLQLNINILFCMNFNTWSQLSVFSCSNESNIFSLQGDLFDYHVIPSEPLVLDVVWSICIHNLNVFLFDQHNWNNSIAKGVTFQNTLGLDFSLFNYQHNLLPLQSNVEYAFADSVFAFWRNGQQVAECNRTAFESMNNSVFEYMSYVSFTQSVKFNQKLSAFIFRGAKMDVLMFSIIDTFVFYTKFEFCQNDNVSIAELNANINQVQISGYNFQLDKSIVHPVVFTLMESINIFGVLKSIDSDIFAPLYNLTDILFELYDLKQFVHNVGLDWTRPLQAENNYSGQVNDTGTVGNLMILVSFTQRIVYSSNYTDFYYQFPDQDFCLFTPFPVHLMVMPYFNTPIENCTCLLYYLYQDYPYFLAALNAENQFASALTLGRSYEHCTLKGLLFMHECLNKSAQMMSLCGELDKNKEQSEQDFTDLDVIYIFYALQYFFNIIFLPLFCILGVLFNLFIIYVVKAQSKELKEPFFDYMKLNAWFNVFYCTISLTGLMNECTGLSLSIYCPLFRTTLFAQYYKIVVVEYLGDAIKICSNVTYIFMNINRYMLIGKDHNKKLQTLAELKPKIVKTFLFLFSFTLSLIKISQYQINYYLDNFDYPILTDLSRPHDLSGAIFSILSFIHDFIVSFLFCILNLVIEVVIVRKLRKELKEKSERMSGMTVSINTQTTLAARIRLKKKQNESTKVEQKAVLMTFANTFLNFTLRLPETSLPIYLLFSRFFYTLHLYSYLCKEVAVCQIFINSTNLLLVLSLNLNYFIYYFFNKKFKEAVIDTLPLFISRHLVPPSTTPQKPAIP